MNGAPTWRESPWRNLVIGGIGFVLGILSSVVVYRTTDWRPPELLGLLFAVVAVIVSIVAFLDTKTVIHKLDALTNMSAFQQARMEYIAQAVHRTTVQGGGTIFIPSGTVAQ